MRSKVFTAFLLAAIVPLGLFVFLDDRAMRRTLTDAASQSLFAAASQTAARFDAFVDDNRNLITTKAQLPILAAYLRRVEDAPATDEQAAQIGDVLRAFTQKDSAFGSSYALLDLEGRDVADSEASGVGADESSRSYFKQALATGFPYVSPVELS